MTAVILSAVRSAVAPRGGAFASLSLQDLGAPVLQAALAAAGSQPGETDEVILSNAMGGGGNPARLVCLAAGLPDRVAGLSIDRQCAGGLDAILMARALILSGAADIVVAGGVESYSRRPMRLRTFPDGRSPEPYDQPPFAPRPAQDPDLAEAANLLAGEQRISRDAQDRWAIESHRKALAASHIEEIVPIIGIATDPFARPLSMRLCARAKPLSGDVTAANTAVAADAAAFCVVVSERVAKGRGIQIVGGTTCGDRPERPGLAPLRAIERALTHAGLSAQDLCVSEVMEAYAAQAIACVQGARLDPARVNLGGGALARGHPIGASGTINAVRLFHELRHRGGVGLATIAAAGGLGSALILAA